MTSDSSAAIGHSNLADPFAAGVAAARMAFGDEGGPPPVFVVLYATVSYDQAALVRGVRSVLPGVPLVGSSTQGISWAGAAQEPERIVGVAVVRSSVITARTARAEGLSHDAEAAGRALADSLVGAGPAPAPDETIIVLYDPLTGADAEALTRGLAAGGFARVVGGGAGQPFGPGHVTYQYEGGAVLRDAAVALRLGGGARFVVELTNGVEPLGLEVTVTAAEANVVREIDGQPALDVWTEQLGAGQVHGYDTACWALGVALPPELREAYEGPISRAVFGFNEERREIILQAPIEPGVRVQLCHRTPQAVFERAVAMARRVRERLEGERPVLALGFECAARPAPFLGVARAAEEVRQMQAELGPDLPWLGTYAWGELAPIGGRSFFHNYTFPLCVICDPRP